MCAGLSGTEVSLGLSLRFIGSVHAKNGKGQDAPGAHTVKEVPPGTAVSAGGALTLSTSPL